MIEVERAGRVFPSQIEAKASTASRSDNPCSRCNTITTATIRGGTDSRPITAKKIPTELLDCGRMRRGPLPEGVEMTARPGLRPLANRGRAIRPCLLPRGWPGLVNVAFCGGPRRWPEPVAACARDRDDRRA